MAQSLKREPAQRRRAAKRNTIQNGDDMPHHQKRQREKYAADQNSVSDVRFHHQALFAGAIVRTACDHDI